MLELIDIHTYYGESHVLHGVSLRVEAGSVVALLGRNGMGKTTIIHSIIGFTPPRCGTVNFKGKELIATKPSRIPQMGIALVPQGRRIFPSLSVEENLTIGARRGNGREPWSLDRVYSLFPVLMERARLRGNLLSGGEQQMLAIGRALMTNPELLLMDEPSEGLAPIIVQELGYTIERLNEKGLSILLVEQNIRLALGVANYVYLVNKGMIVYGSTPVELENDREVMNAHLGVARLLIRRSDAALARGIDPSDSST
jgi:branched-chain amino acid transport system ATP-binding protein